MENKILLEDLKMIYYALQLVFSTKQADAIMNRLVKKLKNKKV